MTRKYGDKSEGQDALSRVEMENPKLKEDNE